MKLTITALLATALIVTACGGPASSGTPAPTVPVAASPSTAPSDLVGVAIELAAQSHAFDLTELVAPADEVFHIVFTNNELLTPHNVEIRDASGTKMFMGKVFDGEKTMTYDVPALPAGEYVFRCTVQPEMKGTLTAG